MRRYKISMSVVRELPGWYAFYYANGHWHVVKYTSAPREAIRFTKAEDAMRTAKQWAEAHKCTTP